MRVRIPPTPLDKSYSAVLAIALALVLLQGCLGRTGPSGPETPTDWPTESWRASTPESQGVDSAALARIGVCPYNRFKPP